MYSISGNCMASIPISTFMCLLAIYKLPGSVHILYFLQQNRQIDGGIYESLTDTLMWKLGLWSRNSFLGNICFQFLVLVICNAWLPSIKIMRIVICIDIFALSCYYLFLLQSTEKSPTHEEKVYFIKSQQIFCKEFATSLTPPLFTYKFKTIQLKIFMFQTRFFVFQLYFPQKITVQKREISWKKYKPKNLLLNCFFISLDPTSKRKRSCLHTMCRLCLQLF